MEWMDLSGTSLMAGGPSPTGCECEGLTVGSAVCRPICFCRQVQVLSIVIVPFTAYHSKNGQTCKKGSVHCEHTRRTLKKIEITTLFNFFTTKPYGSSLKIDQVQPPMSFDLKPRPWLTPRPRVYCCRLLEEDNEKEPLFSKFDINPRITLGMKFTHAASLCD
jgi:hypothetical protein